MGSQGHVGFILTAMVVLGRSRCREVHATAAAQHVGRSRPDGRALGHYRRRQVGRDQNSRRSALPASLIVTAERKFWRCVESGEPPTLFGVDPPKPRIEAVRVVDMTSSNAWAEFSTVFARTRPAYLAHEKAKAELKSLVPEDAQQAVGHGVCARRSKSGAITFELHAEDGHAAG